MFYKCVINLLKYNFDASDKTSKCIIFCFWDQGRCFSDAADRRRESVELQAWWDVYTAERVSLRGECSLFSAYFREWMLTWHCIRSTSCFNVLVASVTERFSQQHVCQIASCAFFCQESTDLADQNKNVLPAAVRAAVLTFLFPLASRSSSAKPRCPCFLQLESPSCWPCATHDLYSNARSIYCNIIRGGCHVNAGPLHSLEFQLLLWSSSWVNLSRLTAGDLTS